MIQNYNALFKAVQDYNGKVSAYGQVQKIYSTRTTLCISLRYPGQTRFLYLGRGGGVEGIWEGESYPASALRCRDKVLEYFRRHLTSGLIARLEVDQADRILIFPYTKFNRTHYFCYFWSGRKSFLLHAFYPEPEAPFKVFTSWRGEIAFTPGPHLLTELLSLFQEVGRMEVHKDQIENKSGELAVILKREETLTGKDKLVSKKEKSLKKKLAFIQDDLLKVREYSMLQAFTKEEDITLDAATELTLGSHHFKFRGLESHHQKLNLIFEKIKKLKKAEKILEERHQTTEKELKNIHLLQVEEMEVKDLPGPKFTVNKTKVAKNIHRDWWEFKLRDKTFAIGKSAQGNDELRSHFASKEDWWMHLDGRESAHLITKSAWHELSEEDKQILASALAEYSKLDLAAPGLIPFIYTQVKYLKGAKGQAGTVLYKKEKRMAVLPRMDWRNFVTSL